MKNISLYVGCFFLYTKSEILDFIYKISIYVIYFNYYILHMISSSLLAGSIVNDLDQNAYTTWHDQSKIIGAINSACSFVLAYGRRPRNLEMAHKEESTAVDTFSFPYEIYYPYWAELDWDYYERTNTPIVWLNTESNWTFYVNWWTIKFKDKWKKANLLCHRGHEKIQSLWNDDINMPDTMFQVLVHVSLWFIYPWGLDIWSSLSNQNYQMAKTLLDTYAKAYWFNLQAEQVEAAGIYTKY